MRLQGREENVLHDASSPKPPGSICAMPVWRLATALKFPPKFTHKPLHFGGFVLFWWDFFLLSTAFLLRFSGG
jgi:hypothetical protein